MKTNKTYSTITNGKSNKVANWCSKLEDKILEPDYDKLIFLELNKNNRLQTEIFVI